MSLVFFNRTSKEELGKLLNQTAVVYFKAVYPALLHAPIQTTWYVDLNLRKKLVKCYIWSIALYGAETWTLRAVDKK